MIKLKTSDSVPITLDMQMTSPSIYLDYCVIADFVQNQNLGNRFRDILFQKDGTLCLSMLHLLEIFSLGTGPTYSKIKSFLSSLEKKFVIFDFNPTAVIERERNWKRGDNSPVFELELTKEIVNQWDGLSPLDFSVLLTGLENNPEFLPKWKQIKKENKEKFKKLFDDARQEYKTNPMAKKNLDESICPDPQKFGTTEYAFCILRKECIKTNEEFFENDSIDFFHSVVAFAHSDFVVLDKKWSRRMKNIQVSTKSAKVFATNEYDLFFNSLSNLTSHY